MSSITMLDGSMTARERLRGAKYIRVENEETAGPSKKRARLN